MPIKPTYLESFGSLGNGLQIKFTGENWGDGLKDTEVKIEGFQLCWITWSDKEAFLKELTEVINKYRI
jgi:hypothetical protein